MENYLRIHQGALVQLPSPPLIPEEIHRPYICLNKFCKPAICSVPVTHAALWTSAVQNSALTWNLVFVWLLLH